MARRRKVRASRQRGPITGALVATSSPFEAFDERGKPIGIEALETAEEARLYLARLGWPEYEHYLPEEERNPLAGDA